MADGAQSDSTNPAAPTQCDSSVNMADVIGLPDEQRNFVLWLLRRCDATMPEVVQQLGQPEEACLVLLQPLLDRGLVVKVPAADGLHFKLRPGRKRGSRMPGEIQ